MSKKNLGNKCQIRRRNIMNNNFLQILAYLKNEILFTDFPISFF